MVYLWCRKPACYCGSNGLMIDSTRAQMRILKGTRSGDVTLSVLKGLFGIWIATTSAVVQI